MCDRYGRKRRGIARKKRRRWWRKQNVNGREWMKDFIITDRETERERKRERMNEWVSEWWLSSSTDAAKNQDEKERERDRDVEVAQTLNNSLQIFIKQKKPAEKNYFEFFVITLRVKWEVKPWNNDCLSNSAAISLSLARAPTYTHTHARASYDVSRQTWKTNIQGMFDKSCFCFCSSRLEKIINKRKNLNK